MGRVTPLPPLRKRAWSEPQAPSTLPKKLEDGRRLRVGAPIGKGTEASVYRAELEGSGGVRRVVALKLFDILASEERERVTASRTQAIQKAALVRHPNVAHVYEVGEHGTQPFVLTELVEGTSLARLIDFYASRGLRFPPDLALFMGIEVAEALAGAARAFGDAGRRSSSYVHGDLTAREVLLSSHGEVKVTDFGLRAAAQSSSRLRLRSSIALRALTLAPEVAQGDSPDAPADVFALGALMRFMLFGERFPAGLPDDAIFDLAAEGTFAPRLFGPRLSPELEDLLERATRADPDRRLGDPGQFAYELRRAALALGVGDGRVFLRSAVAAMTRRAGDLEGPTLRFARSSGGH